MNIQPQPTEPGSWTANEDGTFRPNENDEAMAERHGLKKIPAKAPASAKGGKVNVDR